MTHPHANTPISKLVDGGYLTWAHGAIGFKSWLPVKGNYTMRSGSLICLDSITSARRNFFPGYKSHRSNKREKRPQIHERVKFFQEYVREDPMLRTWEEPGLEADDLISVLVPKYKLPVVAQDKDLLQIRNILMTRIDGSEVTVEHFAGRQPKAITPLVTSREHVLMILCLLGDKSDDIPRLIPPRQLDWLERIIKAKHPWEEAHRIFQNLLLRNLYLAVLPSPWCFERIPSMHQVYESVADGSWPGRKLKSSIRKFIDQNKLLLPAGEN